MIYTQLQTYWEMVTVMRRHQDPELRDCGRRWVAAKATTLTDCRILNKALGYALNTNQGIKSNLRS